MNNVVTHIFQCSPFSEKELRERIAGDLYNHYSTPEPWKLVEDDVNSISWYYEELHRKNFRFGQRCNDSV
ncbi:Protein CBG26000 [Caenorhabditis briggsae]|uniref:Protein CBG26000 n=1 Tax=Caenorhabditis briggsae TaxID=6238 RepID=B6IKV0_CAEBR|nr:Protein CBG26000 [Caenorhabditis briggsae]CAS00530.1 Protein CBG26000 [Caenorhabditis briggsae]